MVNKIWCLFSIDNNYDQPENNLVRWWSEKPSVEALANFLACPLGKTDEGTVFVVKVWSDPEGSRHPVLEMQYRLQQVEEGVSL